MYLLDLDESSHPLGQVAGGLRLVESLLNLMINELDEGIILRREEDYNEVQ